MLLSLWGAVDSIWMPCFMGLMIFLTWTLRSEEVLNTSLEQKGIVTLQKQLKEMDPKYYEKVDLGNPHRMIRALEVGISSGKPYSFYLGKQKEQERFQTSLTRASGR